MSGVVRILVLLALLPLISFGQKECTLTLSGRVYDAATKSRLPFATVYVIGVGKGVEADENGGFKINSFCAGSYKVVCAFVSYKADTLQIELSNNTIRDFFLTPIISEMNEVVVTADREKEHVIATQLTGQINETDLARIRGSTLGETLKQIPGVYSLQTGPTISKPVIHGLYSNRVLILNNGVRLEGQQWGNEHAPEIDPFIATRLSVIKGAASIRYGSDAIGGVILVDPPSLRGNPGINGEMNLVGATNGRMGAISGILNGAFDKRLKGLSWRAQGTFRRGGNARTSNYFLENTGFSETNFSSAIGYKKERFGGEIYFSQFDTRLGIFTGTHAETLADVIAAIQRPTPITPSYFSYSIDRPYQTVKHDMIKVSAYYTAPRGGRLDFIGARQQNERSEYDFVPLSGALNPELFLRIISHTADLIWTHRNVGRFSGNVGGSFITQGNVREFQFLIPNFRNYGGGIFAIEKWTKDKLTIEAGARFDYRWLRVYTLDSNTVKEITPTYHFSNPVGTVGASYRVNDRFTITGNFGTAWKAPTVNELFSYGVHQSAASFEIGNKNLVPEQSYNLTASLVYDDSRMHLQLEGYNNVINHYTFLKPDLQYIHTIRGAFPAFTYTQVNAIYRGADANLSYNLTSKLSLISKTALLFAYNETIHNYLVLVPPQRFENGFKFELGKWGNVSEFYFSASHMYVARQNRVPPNSDYSPPPPGYYLVNATIGCNLHVAGQTVSFNLGATNLLNAAYRDYLNRFRYFCDDLGRNITLRMRILF